MAIELPRRTWIPYLLSIVTVAVFCIAVTSIVLEQNQEETQIPPAPEKTLEFHSRYVKFVVENHRSSAVSLIIKVNNSEAFVGNVPSFSPIEKVHAVGWVDQLNNSNHSHEFIISMHYDGQEHEQSLTLDPGGATTEPVTVRYTIT